MLTRTILSDATLEFASDVREALSKNEQRELPSKYLYDEVGSALFDVISVIPEYGLTRAGERVLRRNADDLVRRLPSPVMVAELGSGSGRKTRWLLEALCRRQPKTYYPIDISAAALDRCRRELALMDSISIVGFERAYLDGLLEAVARRRDGEHILVLFLGSTIGNFDRPAGDQFLREVRAMLLPEDRLVLATDLEKSIPQLLLAYDDPAGITAAFNLYLLARINRELDADFDLSRFIHEARYDEKERRIEMHLRSSLRQTVNIPKADYSFELSKGETIWTESSHKYDLAEVRGMARRTGFRCDVQWVDEDWPFAQNLFVAC